MFHSPCLPPICAPWHPPTSPQDTSKTGDRCVLWSQILGEGNVTLDLPIKCYGGYWSEGEPDVVLT